MKLKKPTKIVEYKGIKVMLFRSGPMHTLFGRGHFSFTLLEKKGYIPKPMFYNGKMRLYTNWEIQAAFDCAVRYGIPARFSKFALNSDFVINLKKSWEQIHAKIEAGVVPEMPVKLVFDSEDALKAFLRNTFTPHGLAGDVFYENLKDEFLNHRSYV